jgi:hypothetical protein
MEKSQIVDGNEMVEESGFKVKNSAECRLKCQANENCEFWQYCNYNFLFFEIIIVGKISSLVLLFLLTLIPPLNSFHIFQTVVSGLSLGG